MTRPIAEPDSVTAPWWDATRNKSFVLQRCRSCESFQHYPRAVCTKCASVDLEFKEVSGRGQIYSFSIVHRPPSEHFLAPYAVALIRLQEGPVMLSNVVAADLEGLVCEQAVEVAWEPLSDGRNLPVFKPRGEN